ncbi:MAG: penicillin-binding protein 1C, partial [Burkholderiaceae bacterium]|nr:penicillin-binding protein 1C [Burkholderiaceae bacterium]
AQRACGVLRDMQGSSAGAAPRRAQGAAPSAAPPVDCDALDLFTTAALQRRAFDASEGVAPHFARYLMRQRFKDGAVVPERVPSTLRAPLQRFAVQTLSQHLRELRGRNVEDGAVLVLDNATGAVLAWVGSSGQLSQASEVDGVLALRQPGSTLKPFLYAQAIAERRLTAASLVDDSPAHIATASGLYIPQNYDRQFKGWVSVRTALAASLNVPAVRTLVMVSPDAFHRQLGAVGLPLRESGDYFGYSLALGSPEVPLLHLTNAYRTLANDGRSSAVAFSDVAKPRFAPALDARASFIVGDILSDGNARARTFGTDSVLATRFWTAVKTGTSKDMRDNWAVGWSERYTVGVWVGNASGAAMHDVSGTSGAATIWSAVMGFLHAREPSRAPKAPAGLVQAAVRFGPAPSLAALGASTPQPLEAARQEWFVLGTQQAVFAMDTGAGSAYGTSARGQKESKFAATATSTATAASALTGAAARITAPASGTVIAVDPDIPPTRQRLQFAATGERLQFTATGDGVLLWRMDGKPLGRGPQVAWLPWPGRHVVQITNAQGQVLDEIRLEVRGAGAVVVAPQRGAAH